jgi:hypothetical protein
MDPQRPISADSPVNSRSRRLGQNAPFVHAVKVTPHAKRCDVIVLVTAALQAAVRTHRKFVVGLKPDGFRKH